MIMSSWFGDMTRAIDMYCERTSGAWDAEPLNAVSNAAFFIAAWAAWRLQERHPNAAFGGAIRALCIIIAVVGAGSLTSTPSQPAGPNGRMLFRSSFS